MFVSWWRRTIDLEILKVQHVLKFQTPFSAKRRPIGDENADRPYRRADKELQANWLLHVWVDNSHSCCQLVGEVWLVISLRTWFRNSTELKLYINVTLNCKRTGWSNHCLFRRQLFELKIFQIINNKILIISTLNLIALLLTSELLAIG